MALSIEWFGLSSLRLQTKIQNTEVTVVTDPPEASTGVKLPRNLEADIVVSSLDDPAHRAVDNVGGKPFVICNPGEYEIKNVFVYGLENDHRHAAYILEVDDLVLMFIGGVKNVSKQVLDRAENVDILFVPVGGGAVMDAKEAAAVANEVQPRIVIPVHYASKDSKIKLDGVEKFLKEMGAAKTVPVSKIKISKKDLPQEEMNVMLLTNE